MANIAQLLTGHIDIWTGAETEKKSGRGRASGANGSVYGVKKLRELILELAVRGKLVPQDPNDEPASELLKRIQAEKAKLMAEGKLKKEKPLAPIADEEKPFELPRGWEWVRVNDIGHDWGQKTPNQNFTYIEVSAIDNQLGLVLTPEVLNPEDAPSRARKVVKKNTIIYSTVRPYLLNVAVIDTEFKYEPIASTAFAVIQPYCEMPSRYFLHYLRSPIFIKYVESVQTGIAYPAINDSQFYSGLLPLPPLTEQHRIVAKVDELMALCDQLEQQHSNAQQAHETLVSQLLATLTQSQNAAEFNANGQRIYAHFDLLFTTEASIDALKQTLLQLAVMGKLVPQDPDDEPASELLKRIQAEKAKLIAEGKLKKEKPLTPITDEEKPFELPHGWKWVRLSDVSTYIQYGYTDSANQINRDVLFLRITDIQDDFVDWSTVPGCNSNLNQVQDYLLSENDIVIARTGGTIGKSYLVKNLTVDSIFASYLIRIGKIESVNHKFKKLYFGSLLYWNQLYANSMGTGQPNVNGTALKGLLFSLPPIKEQHRIVAKVDVLMALCDQLKTRLQQAGQQQQAIADALVARAVQ